MLPILWPVEAAPVAVAVEAAVVAAAAVVVVAVVVVLVVVVVEARWPRGQQPLGLGLGLECQVVPEAPAQRHHRPCPLPSGWGEVVP